MQSRFVVAVAVAVPLRKTFDYLPNPDLPERNQYPIGARCMVTIGRRKMLGVIVRLHQHPSVPPERLKAIESVLDQTPALPAPVLKLAKWISDYYQAPLGEVLVGAMPPPMRQPLTETQLQSRVSTRIWFSSGTPAPNLKGTRQKALMGLLSQHPEGLSQKKLLDAGFSAAQLKSLAEKGLISYRTDYLAPLHTQPDSRRPTLSGNQRQVLHAIQDLNGNFATILLEGVTGSGKTEVYLEWIDQLLAASESGQILVMIPEISLTPQTMKRFQDRFGSLVCLYHSGMSDSERLLTWKLIATGKSRVALGTRSSIMLPFTDLVGVIVDEEHDSSFKQQDNARYHARDLAIIRAQHCACPVILGSATPSFETLHNASTGKYLHLRLDQRAGATPLPEVRLIDVRSRPLDGGISPPLLQEIRQTVDAGEQVMVFINRRGYAPVMMCVDCGWIAECHSCDVRLTYHRQASLLKCHHCDKQYRPPQCCPKCQSSQIKPIGAGTERTEDYLEEQFPETPVIRIDRDTTQNKGSLEALLAPIRDGQPCIIVGTQMLAKGHDFPHLSTVAILNADGGLFSSDFRSAEKTAQLLIQVAGRAGRREQPGRVFIQSQIPEHPLLQHIAQHNYRQVYTSEMVLREQGKLPPCRPMALIRAEGANLDLTMKALWQLRDSMEAQSLVSLEIHGPFPSLLQRKQNRFHGLIWLFAPSKAELRRSLAQWLAVVDASRIKLPANTRWILDVDPIETL